MSWPTSHRKVEQKAEAISPESYPLTLLPLHSSLPLKQDYYYYIFFFPAVISRCHKRKHSFGHPHHIPVRVPNATAQRDPAEQEFSPGIGWETPAAYSGIGSRATASELTRIPFQSSAEEFSER